MKMLTAKRLNVRHGNVDWKTLAAVDAELTKKYVDVVGGVAHFVSGQTKTQYADSRVCMLEEFLNGEYKRSLQIVSFEKVNFLPHGKFSSFGVFAMEDLSENAKIEGLSGYLSEIKKNEIETGCNDFSIIQSTRIGKQWLMLGPISFVNSCCMPNAKYVRSGQVMDCVATKKIEKGVEITVIYDKHFFGEFNAECLCPHKTLHGNIFAEMD